MTSEVREGWSWLTLRDVLAPGPGGGQVQQGWSPQCDKSPAGDHEWGVLKTTAIQAGAFYPEHNKRLPSDLEPRPQIEVKAGDVLLTNAGPRARCAVPCLVRQSRPRLMLSGKIYRFRPSVEVMDPRFLEAYLLSPQAQGLLDAMKTGISDSGLNLTRDRFLSLGVPVPPLGEQARIVQILDDHLSRLTVAEGWLESAAKRGGRFAEVTAEHQVSGAWPTVAISEIASVGSGATPLRSRRDYYEGGTIPWVTSGALNDPYVREASAMITEKALTETAVKLWPAGTLLVAMYGEGRTRGRCSELTFPSTTNQACAAIVLDDEFQQLRPWVKLVLRSRYEQMRRLAAGGVQPNLSLRLIKAMAIPVPPEEARALSLRRVGDADAAVERLRTDLRNAGNRARNLRRALLTAAFSGRLTASEQFRRPSRELSRV